MALAFALPIENRWGHFAHECRCRDSTCATQNNQTQYMFSLWNIYIYSKVYICTTRIIPKAYLYLLIAHGRGHAQRARDDSPQIYRHESHYTQRHFKCTKTNTQHKYTTKYYIHCMRRVVGCRYMYSNDHQISTLLRIQIIRFLH